MKIIKITLFLLYFSLGNILGQEMILELSPTGNSPVERNYQFTRVIDARVEQSIGIVYDSDRNKLPATFNGQLDQQVLEFYNSKISVPKNPSYKLHVKIYNLDLKEIYVPDQRGYKGTVQLSVGIFLESKNELVHLVDFNSQAQYGRPANKPDNVQISIQRLFENSWEYFDAWLGTQYQTNRSLAKKVRLNIIDPIRPSSRDTVFYDPDRPLTWDDFRDIPTAVSSFNATIFSSLSIAGNATIVNGEIVQTIDVKVYMLPSQSWVKNANEYANNHEQRHFDLTRIAADRMIAKLKNEDLDPTLFEAKLNDIYLDAHREMTRLQELYDSQSDHGLNREMQSNWNMAIRKALAGEMESLEKLIAK